MAGQISGVALVSQPHKKATIIGALAASGKHLITLFFIALNSYILIDIDTYLYRLFNVLSS